MNSETTVIAKVDDISIEQDHENGLCHIIDGENAIRLSLEYHQLERLASQIIKP
jgi:hypothetical protein